MRILLLGALASIATGWMQPAHAGSGQSRAYEAACRQETPSRFVIEGEIAAPLLRCVQANLAPTTREIVLNSPGGDVAEAIEIADLLADRSLTARVTGHCASACASILLPMASRIVVEPGALVMIHPGPDDGMMAQWELKRPVRLAALEREGLSSEAAEAQDLEETQRQRAVIDAVRQFLQRHDLHPGWMVWRLPHPQDPMRFGLAGLRHVSPNLVQDISDDGWILVEEPLMRSCLPRLQIDPYQNDLRRRWLRSPLRLGLISRKITPSGTAVCA